MASSSINNTTNQHMPNTGENVRTEIQDLLELTLGYTIYKLSDTEACTMSRVHTSEEYDPLRVHLSLLLDGPAVAPVLLEHFLTQEVSISPNLEGNRTDLRHVLKVLDHLLARRLDAAIGDILGCVGVDVRDESGERRTTLGVGSGVDHVRLC